MVIITIEHEGVLLSLTTQNGDLRVAAEGVDVGPVRGRKRLAGPQLAATMTATRAIYQRLARSPEYRAQAQGTT
jgi:hypothetical protein